MNNMDQKFLTEELIKASEAYYNGKDSGMSDIEFDKKVEELRQMEDKSGIVYPGSPTVNVGAEVVTELKKVTHESPALSLDKVKYADREKLTDWLKNSNGNDSAVISWKLDGLTCVLTYNGGKLVQAATRGNGTEGSDITHNARFFKGVPQRIPYEEHLVVRGEALMTFEEFERVNVENNGEYENPRNLASATIQMLDVNESKKRNIQFIVFELVTPEPGDDEDEMMVPIEGREWTDLRYQQDRFAFLEYLGFDVVQHDTCDSMDVLRKIEEFKADLQNLKYPTDGLVITFNNMIYGMSLGNTGHHFRHSLALKWSDETKTTTVRNIEWSVGKTGVITPVAVFDPVRLGLGSTVTRASLHNISIMRSMTAEGSSFEKEPIRIGSEAKVYLANQIIPQILSIRNTWDNGLTCPTKYVEIPDRCPVCGGKTEIVKNNGIATLHCTNHDGCVAQQVGKLMNTFSKDGLFIKGLGESQIQDLIECGLVNSGPLSVYIMADEDRIHGIYPKESEFAEKVSFLWDKEGWGKKKWENLINAIEASRNTTLQKFLYSLNIPLLGNDLSKKLSKFWHDDINHFRTWMAFVKEEGRDKAFLELTAIDGIGNEKAKNLVKWAEDITVHREKYEALLDLIDELYFPEPSDSASDNSLIGLTFVITGAVHEYKNRDEFKASVEARGGKVSGSVSNKTNFLVNNNVESISGKNKKAKELGIEIISEDEFVKRFGK